MDVKVKEKADNSRLLIILAIVLLPILCVVVVAVLGTLSLLLINPAKQIESSKDQRQREEVVQIAAMLELYILENEELPNVNGKPLPVVTKTNVMEKGVDASDLTFLVPDFLTTIPTTPDGKEYKVGKLNDGGLVIATRLSDGDLFTYEF